MVNFAPKLKDSTNDQLWNYINESEPRFAALASDELTRRNLSQLKEAIKKNAKETANLAKSTLNFNTETSRQTKKLISLTRLIAFLTLIMIVGLAFQIYIAIFESIV